VLAGNDVYLNVAGGMRITEPAADLAVATALASSASGTPLPPETVAFGEISLSGDIRPVSRSDARLKEAAKLGFKRAIVPRNPRGTKAQVGDLAIEEIAHVRDLIDLFPPRDDEKPRMAANRPPPDTAGGNTRPRRHG
jgi:DNA repair protein RadA/Sms